MGVPALSETPIEIDGSALAVPGAVSITAPSAIMVPASMVRFMFVALSVDSNVNLQRSMDIATINALQWWP